MEDWEIPLPPQKHEMELQKRRANSRVWQDCFNLGILNLSTVDDRTGAIKPFINKGLCGIHVSLASLAQFASKTNPRYFSVKNLNELNM